jgi:hypothetical protein
MKHTPVDECQMCHSVEHGHRSIALGYGVICDDCLPKLRKMADAAPDLLEACKLVMVTGQTCFADILKLGYIQPPNGNDYRKAKDIARQAIAKAEGRD